MKKVKVLLDFIRPSVPVKLVKGRNVVNGLTGNPSFPTPDVELTLITDATDLLESSFAVAQNGRPEDTAKMHKNELAWEKLMRKEALYVERITDGDEAAILSSGFSISHQPAPALRPEFSLKAGKLPGTVILRRKAYPGAKAYLWQYCIGAIPANESEWLYAGASGNATYLVLGLNSLTKYGFRVAPIMSESTSAFCDPILFTVA